MEYPIVIAPLPDEDGGGFVGLAPDLLGCMSDGETPQEALANTQQAVLEWLETAHRRGMEIPGPGTAGERDRQRRARLVSRVREVANSVDKVESRMHDLELMVREVEEKLENVGAWERFAVHVGIPVAQGAEEPHSLPC